MWYSSIAWTFYLQYFLTDLKKCKSIAVSDDVSFKKNTNIHTEFIFQILFGLERTYITVYIQCAWILAPKKPNYCNIIAHAANNLSDR